MPKTLFIGFIIFSLLGCIVVGENFHLISRLTPQNSSELANFVCDAVHDVMRREIGLKRVALVRYDTTFESGFTDEIGKCLASDVTVLIMDLKAGLTNVSLQKPSMIVLLTEKIKEVKKT